MAKFDGIERNHVEKALKAIDEPWPRIRGAKAWWIKSGRRLYPLKYVVTEAIKRAPRVSLHPRDFSPDEAVPLIKRLGFEVVKKQ